MNTRDTPVKFLILGLFNHNFTTFTTRNAWQSPAVARQAQRTHRGEDPSAAIESSCLLHARCYLQRGRSISSTPRGVASAQRFFCPWWPWPLTFDLDIQTHPSEGSNTSSVWIWCKSVQRFLSSIVECESQESNAFRRFRAFGTQMVAKPSP